MALGAFANYDGIADYELFAVPIVLALIVAMAWYWLTEPRRLRDLYPTRRVIRFHGPMPLGRDAGPLPLDAIAQIHAIERTGAGWLLIAADEAEIRTGHGLSREAPEWLRDYLTAAVVEA